MSRSKVDRVCIDFNCYPKEVRVEKMLAVEEFLKSLGYRWPVSFTNKPLCKLSLEMDRLVYYPAEHLITYRRIEQPIVYAGQGDFTDADVEVIQAKQLIEELP